MDLSDDVAKFTKGCEHLLAAIARHTEFTETETQMISYYWREITAQTQSLRDKQKRVQE